MQEENYYFLIQNEIWAIEQFCILWTCNKSLSCLFPSYHVKDERKIEQWREERREVERERETCNGHKTNYIFLCSRVIRFRFPDPTSLSFLSSPSFFYFLNSTSCADKRGRLVASPVFLLTRIIAIQWYNYTSDITTKMISVRFWLTYTSEENIYRVSQKSLVGCGIKARGRCSNLNG